MRKLILLMLSVLVAECVRSQDNSTATHELASNENSRSELIQKSRDSIVDAITVGDRDKATELMLHAKTTFDDDNYQTFSAVEIWDLTVWSRKYKMAASEMVRFSSSVKQSEQNKKTYSSNLSQTLQDSICSNISFFVSDINSDASLTSCEREVLLLYIKNLKRIPSYEKRNGTLMNHSGIFNPDTLNVLSNEFLQQYPGSEFEQFVRNTLRYEYKKSKLMLGGAVFFGTASIKGVAYDYLSGGTVCAGWDVNLSYNSIIAGAQTNASAGHDYGTHSEYEKPVEVYIFSPNFYIGYWLLYRGISILPSVGYGRFRLKENAVLVGKNGELENLKSSRSPYWKPVLSVEVGYGKPIFVPTNTHVSSGRMAFGLRYSFQPIDIHFLNGVLSGAIHRVTLCYRMSAGKLKRVY